MYYQHKNISLYNQDFFTFKCQPVDLIVTSPPYNFGIEYENHNDDMSPKEYAEFTEAYLKKCYDLLKEDGRMCLNVPFAIPDKFNHFYKDLLTMTNKSGFKYRDTILWIKDSTSKSSAWGSYLSASSPSMIHRYEVIILLYKGNWKKDHKGISDITKEEWAEFTNGIWRIQGSKVPGHPASFPVEIPFRCIKLFTYTGARVLDPFVGSGSTLIACVKSGRAGIGTDKGLTYCELSKERLLEETGLNKQEVHDLYA